MKTEQLTNDDRKFYKTRLIFLKSEIEKLEQQLDTCFSDRTKDIILDRIKSRTADYNQCEKFLNNFA
jgi:hypothetical protein